MDTKSNINSSINSKKQHQCEICKKFYVSQTTLNNHIQKYHKSKIVENNNSQSNFKTNSSSSSDYNNQDTNKTSEIMNKYKLLNELKSMIDNDLNFDLFEQLKIIIDDNLNYNLTEEDDIVAYFERQFCKINILRSLLYLEKTKDLETKNKVKN